MNLIMKRRKKITEEEILWAIKKYKEGKSINWIGNQLGFKNSHGGLLVKKIKEKVCIKSPNRYNLQADYFNSINTSEKAYWLGFIMADGYVCIEHKKKNVRRRLGLCLNQSDKTHLEKFCKALNSNHVIKFRKDHKNNKVYLLAYVEIYNKQICLDLIKHGCVPNKSKTLMFPSISNELFFDFIRGYFDGDGHISFKGSSIEFVKKNSDIAIGITMASKKMADEMNKRLLEKGIENKIYTYKTRHAFCLNILKSSKLKFLNLLYYSPLVVSLDRKRERNIKASEKLVCF